MQLSVAIIEDGKDIVTPLSGLGKPDVWLVGSAFGVFGAILQKLVLMIPWFGHHTDSVAFTVFISAIVARLMFGDSLFGSKPALQASAPRRRPLARMAGKALTVHHPRCHVGYGFRWRRPGTQPPLPGSG